MPKYFIGNSGIMKNLKEKQFQNKMKVIAGIIISITVENNIIFICYKVGVGLYTFAIVSIYRITATQNTIFSQLQRDVPIQ